jgi:hypothetical protein
VSISNAMNIAAAALSLAIGIPPVESAGFVPAMRFESVVRFPVASIAWADSPATRRRVNIALGAGSH